MTPYTDNIVTLPTVPKVRLYVEKPGRDEAWFVHVGHVTDRGRWRTDPHAHPGYGQVIFVRQGRGVMNLEGSSMPFEAPCVLLLPPDCVHGLDYEDDTDRWVVTVEAAYLAQVNGKLQEIIQLWTAPRRIPVADDANVAAELYRVIRELEHEAATARVGRPVGTEALLTFLMLNLARVAASHQVDQDSATRGDVRLVERFRELVDQHFRQNLALSDYASMLAVTHMRLRAACASACGQSPIKLLHARIITEAKRNLIFDETSIEQIAFSLGFSNAAYFTRFFRKEVGQTPSRFRTGARGGLHLVK